MIAEINSYSGWVQKLEEATCSAYWQGRTVTFKDSTSIDLIELSKKITTFIENQGCSKEERPSLIKIDERLRAWFQETDRVANQNKLYQVTDFFTYPVEEEPILWKPGSKPLPMEYLYTDKEWEAQFPGVTMPQPAQVIGKCKFFSEEQIKTAQSQSFVLV